MKLQIEANDLRDLLSGASLPVAKSFSAIMECVHLTAKDNTLRCVGVGNNMEAIGRQEAAVFAPGTASVNARDATSACAALTGYVHIETTERGLCFSGAGCAATLPITRDEFDFDRMERPRGEVEIEHGTDLLRRAAPFCARDDLREFTQGVGFDGDHAIATDGARMYISPAKGGNGIIPMSAIPIIAKIGGRLFMSETSWRAEAENIQATGRLLSDQTPDWRRLISPGRTVATCEADDLSDAIKSASLGRAREVFFETHAGSLRVSGERFDGTSPESFAEISADGCDGAFLLNCTYIQKILAPFSGCVINLLDNGNTILIQPEGRDDFALIGLVRDVRQRLPERAAA